jgi:AmmeMemoRadiSam system protein A
LTPEEDHQADQQFLLRLARRTIESAAVGDRLPSIDRHSLSSWLRAPGASFVTLTHQGALRGCIGGLKAEDPLAEDVRQHARAAALEDPRFPPVQPGEVDGLSIEISVLGAAIPVSYGAPEDLLRSLRPGVDGVILQYGSHRATFLPQVWEKVPDPEEFLSLLCQKAYLSGSAWHQLRLEVLTYQVESFHESPGTSAAGT